MARSQFQMVPPPKSRFGNERDRVGRVPFGLGAAPGTPGAAERCLKCSFGNVPVIEEHVVTFPLPLTDDEIQRGIGMDIFNPLASLLNIPGAGSIDSTFVAPGVLQTDLWTVGMGVHIFCEPQSLVAPGNGFETPDAPSALPPSPTVYTQHDLYDGAGAPATPTGLTGLTDGDTITAATLDWGDPAWRAGWHFINGYQVQWKTSQRELVLNEQAADISYFGSFADALAAGTSEVPVINYAMMVNAMYRSKHSPTIFMPTNYERVGSYNSTPGVATTNQGNFHPTRAYDQAPTTWGGLRWQGYGCRGQMYRQIESPCFLERGIPISISFNVNDPVHQTRMMAALSIDTETGSQNLSPDVNVTGLVNLGLAELATDVTGAGNIDVLQVVSVLRQVYKGGILKVGIKLKGWELPGAWKQWCMQNIPQMFASPTTMSPQLGT